MSRRLVDTYRIGDEVELRFGEKEPWRSGVVVGLAHPGVWVNTSDGRAWYVTNGRRIRPASQATPPPGQVSSS